MSDVREQIEEVGIRDRARADELNVCIEQIAQQVPVGLRGSRSEIHLASICVEIGKRRGEFGNAREETVAGFEGQASPERRSDALVSVPPHVAS